MTGVPFEVQGRKSKIFGMKNLNNKIITMQIIQKLFCRRRGQKFWIIGKDKLAFWKSFF